MTATVLVTSRSFGSGSVDVAAPLREAGLEVVHGSVAHDLAELRAALSSAVAWIAGVGPVTKEHLAAAPHLRVIARYGVGVDAVDLAAAAARGVVVTNTPGANAESVADHTMALMLAALRRVVDGDRRARAGDRSGVRAKEVGSLRVGLVGVGRIGGAVARRLRGFGCAIYGRDPYVGPAQLAAAGVEPGESMIPTDVDVVSLHAPGTAQIVTADWIDRARPGLLIVNTARAALVDERAVADGLRAGRLGAYATDVLSTDVGAEPSVLLANDLADRVVVTPHWAAQTVEAVDRMGAMTVESVLDVLAGRSPGYLVVAGGDR